MYIYIYIVYNMILYNIYIYIFVHNKLYISVYICTPNLTTKPFWATTLWPIPWPLLQRLDDGGRSPAMLGGANNGQGKLCIIPRTFLYLLYVMYSN